MAHILQIDPITSSAEDVAEALGADPEHGLSSAEAAQRLAEQGPNELRGKPSTPKWRRFVEQFNSPLIYLLLAAIVVSAIAWALDTSPDAGAVPVDAIVIALIVLLNAVLGWYWADPLAALVIAAVAVKEGRDAWRGETCCRPLAEQAGEAECESGCCQR